MSVTLAKLTSCVAFTSSLIACATSPPVPQALDYRSISAVEAEIKYEIGLYMVAAARLPPTIKDVSGKAFALPTDSDAYSCGGGDIRFDINNVKADLLVTDENLGSLGGGISAPIQVGSLGFSAKASNDTSNTQELVYNVWFDPLSKQDPDQPFLRQTVTYESLKAAPIALALINLRDSLIASGLKDDPYTHQPRAPLPCHWNWNIDPAKPGGDPGNSIKFGITVVKETSGTANVSIYVINLNASDDSKSTRANTLTVSFYQHDTLDVIPPARLAPKLRGGVNTSGTHIATTNQLASNEWSPWGKVVSDFSDVRMIASTASDSRVDGNSGLNGSACPIQITPHCTIGDHRYECLICNTGPGAGGRSRTGGNGLDSVPPSLKTQTQ